MNRSGVPNLRLSGFLEGELRPSSSQQVPVASEATPLPDLYARGTRRRDRDPPRSRAYLPRQGQCRLPCPSPEDRHHTGCLDCEAGEGLEADGEVGERSQRREHRPSRGCRDGSTYPDSEHYHSQRGNSDLQGLFPLVS